MATPPSACLRAPGGHLSLGRTSPASSFPEHPSLHLELDSFVHPGDTLSSAVSVCVVGHGSMVSNYGSPLKGTLGLWGPLLGEVLENSCGDLNIIQV